MSLRYTASGGILLIGARLAGAQFPNRREWTRTALNGLLVIGCGTGSLAISEQWMPSGTAALIVTTQPFWAIAAESYFSGDRVHWPTIRAALIGLVGVVFLLVPGASGPAFGLAALGGFLLLQFGGLTWAVGSIQQRRMNTQTHSIVNGAIQQFATGLVFGVIALAFSRHAVWNAKGIGAVAYLAVFGGIVGYSAFIYAMDRLPVALVSIYTYINPIVAVLLGWVFYREPFGWREVIAMAIIFIGVGLVKRSSTRRELPAIE